MKPLIVEYSRTAETGMMDKETIRVVIEVGLNDTAKACLDRAKLFVASQLENGPDPIEKKHQHVLDTKEDQLLRDVEKAQRYFADKAPPDQTAIL